MTTLNCGGLSPPLSKSASPPAPPGSLPLLWHHLVPQLHVFSRELVIISQFPDCFLATQLHIYSLTRLNLQWPPLQWPVILESRAWAWISMYPTENSPKNRRWEFIVISHMKLTSTEPPNIGISQSVFLPSFNCLSPSSLGFFPVFSSYV